MKMEYVNVNGYLIPKLENGPIADNTIGKYGMMRARYLDEHRPMERDQMLLDGTLAQHLTDIDCEAHRQVESLTKVLATEAKMHREIFDWIRLVHASARTSCGVTSKSCVNFRPQCSKNTSSKQYLIHHADSRKSSLSLFAAAHDVTADGTAVTAKLPGLWLAIIATVHC